MPAVPTWFTASGGYPFTVSITRVTRGADGTLSSQASNSLLGQLDSVTLSSENTQENISAMDSRRGNNVILESATTFTLEEILKGNGTNILANVAYSFDYALISVTRGGQSYSFYGVIGSYSESLRKGKSMGTLTVTMVDPASGNPTYV